MNRFFFFCFSVVGRKGQELPHSHTTQMLGCDFKIWNSLVTKLNQSSF